jgi:hypothetical protein
MKELFEKFLKDNLAGTERCSLKTSDNWFRLFKGGRTSSWGNYESGLWNDNLADLTNNNRLEDFEVIGNIYEHPE